VDRLDRAREVSMSDDNAETGTEAGKARIERHLWELFDAAMAAKAFAPALKALELMGREHGMWRPEQTAGVDPLSLIAPDPLGIAGPEEEDET